MTNVWTITWRELKSYFVSPLAYILSAVWLVLAGIFFSLSVNNGDASMRGVFPTLLFLFWLIAPLLTMRLLAEEQRMGTLELLLTAPLHDWQVVIGKFLGNMIWYATLVILPMVSYVVILIRYGSPDYGPLVTGYFGMLLMGAACFSIGLFTSSLTQNQVIAAVLSFAILIFLWISDFVSNVAGPGMVSDIGTYLSITHHYNDFFGGVVNSTDIIYMLSVVAISLFLTTQTLQSRRWR